MTNTTDMEKDYDELRVLLLGENGPKEYHMLADIVKTEQATIAGTLARLRKVEKIIVEVGIWIKAKQIFTDSPLAGDVTILEEVLKGEMDCISIVEERNKTK
jgi:hypothetical protein